jgi:hypothetical protein
MKVYFFRHQAAGVLWQYPFSAPLTDEQLASLARLCFQSHGERHPKTGEPYWCKGVAVEVLSPGDIPAVPERALSVASKADTSRVTVEGVGHVDNPTE